MTERLRWAGAAAFFVVWLILCAASPDAKAEYQYCNNTSYVLRSAIAYYADGQWTSRGWWTLLPGKCRTVMPQDLRHGTYYAYAESVPGHVGGTKYFAGDEPFCTGDGYFTLYGRDCVRQGAEEGQFIKVEVGRERSWSTTFTEPTPFTSEKAEIAGVQRLLSDNGYDPGQIDGNMGLKTRQAIAAFKTAHGLTIAELISEELLNALTEVANTKAEEQGLNFCNRTDEALWAAVAHQSEGVARSRGWWKLDPGECSKVIRERLTPQEYAVFAVVDGSGGEAVVAGGEEVFCTAEVKFDIEGRDDCDGRGYNATGFVAIDVGDAASWTQNFSLPESGGLFSQ